MRGRAVNSAGKGFTGRVKTLKVGLVSNPKLGVGLRVGEP